MHSLFLSLKMKNFFCATGIFFCLLTPSHAAIINFYDPLILTPHTPQSTYAGDIAFHTDVVKVDFTITETSFLTLSTDSRAIYNSSISAYNFDPYLTLWQDIGNGDGIFIADNDDIDSQNFDYNSYLSTPLTSAQNESIPYLSAGNYFFTLSASQNSANDRALTFKESGFAFDYTIIADATVQTTPIAINLWDQVINPSDPIVDINNPNPNTTLLTDASVVIAATQHNLGGHWNVNLTLTPAAIPLPGSIWFFSTAFAGYLFSRRKR